MKRLLLWLIWLFAMKEFLSYLAQNWNVVSEAPLAFIILFLAALLLSLAITEELNRKKSDTLQEQIKIRDKQLEYAKENHEIKIEKKEKELNDIFAKQEKDYKDKIQKLEETLTAIKNSTKEAADKNRERMNAEEALINDFKARIRIIVFSSKYGKEPLHFLKITISEKIEKLKILATEIVQGLKNDAEWKSEYEKNFKTDILILRETLIGKLEKNRNVKCEVYVENWWRFMQAPTFQGYPSKNPELIRVLKVEVYELPQNRKQLLEIIEELENLSRRLPA